MHTRQLPEGCDRDIPTFQADAKGLASRESSAKVLKRGGEERPLADRRQRRPHAVHQDADDLRRCR